MQSGDSELVVCEIGQGGLAVAGTSGPLHQPLAAVEAGNKAGGLIAVGPGGLQVRAGRTDFEDAAEGGMANACSCRRPEPPPGEHYRPSWQPPRTLGLAPRPVRMKRSHFPNVPGCHGPLPDLCSSARAASHHPTGSRTD